VTDLLQWLRDLTWWVMRGAMLGVVIIVLLWLTGAIA